MNFTLSSSKLNAIENHDDFLIVCLDSSKNVPEQLENITDYLHKCNSFEECEKYIETIQTERKVLLVLADFYVYVSYFNEYSQVQSIYILNKNLQDINSNNEQCSKLVHVFNDECILIERLRQDMVFTYRCDLPISTCSINEITNDQSLIKLDDNTLFYWNQLLTYYLVNTSNTNMDELKKHMIKQCQLEYQKDETELRKINDFDKNCTSNNVLYWYTKDSFVYRLVNKAFRTRNMDLICKFRYFIILLYNELKELSVQQQKNNLRTVYRAQCMKKNELELLRTSIGHLISTNIIMSTTQNRNVANIYLNSKEEISVMFEINIGIGNNIIYPFADISQWSNFPEEKEVLFFAGAVFRIDSLEVGDNSTWTLKLTLSNEKVKLIEQLTKALEAIMSLEAKHCHLSSLIDDAHLFKKYHLFLTKRKLEVDEVVNLIIRIFSNGLIHSINYRITYIDYYKQLLSDESFIDHPKCIVLNTIIGNNYFRLKQYDDAFIYYGIALSLLDDQNRVTGEIYNHLGDVWREKKQDKIALSCYEQASKIIQYHDNKEKNLIKIYKKISDIYYSQNNNHDAVVYNTQANEIIQYHEENPKFTDTNIIIKHLQLYNIKLDHCILKRAYNLYVNGMNILKEKKFSEGLEHLKQAEEMFKNHYFEYDSMRILILTIICEHQALAYLGLKDCLNAVVVWKKAIDLRMIYKL